MIFSKLNKLYYILIFVMIIVAVVIIVWIGRSIAGSSLTVGSDNHIDDTPLQVEMMRTIGQWEFLSVSDEEIVDTVRRGLFSDDHLLRIYYGTLRIGIDMQKLSDNAFVRNSDSLIVRLPAVKLLDEDFIDEARTRSFFESGKWTPADREDMFHRAHRMMMQRCLTDENILEARKNAEVQMRQLMSSLGYDKVRIVFFD